MTTSVDYGRVAARYDANPIRRQVPPDPVLAELAARGGIVRVLDLACGTGAFVASQLAHCARVAWHACDASDAMLAEARRKLPDGTCAFAKARAEALPYADASFDYVVCRYAFHHFEDKQAALVEMRRVLAPGGRIRLENLVPELSRDWWLYGYFPEAVAVDERRFWPLARVEESLWRQGLAVETRTRPMPLAPFAEALAEARNRETSELLLIPEAAYAAGLARMEARALERGEAAPHDPGLVIADVTAARQSFT